MRLFRHVAFPARLCCFPTGRGRHYAILDRYENLRVPVAEKTSRKRKNPARKKRRKGRNVISSKSRDYSEVQEVLPLPPRQRAPPLVIPEQPENARVNKVALVGLANAGKSTLLNVLIGQHLAAVSDKAHTTRSRILGAFTRGSTQVVFMDTPGVVRLSEHSKRPRHVVRGAWDALAEAHAMCIVIDASHPDDARLNELSHRINSAFDALPENPPKPYLVLNKIDLISDAASVSSLLERVRRLQFPGHSDPYLISALEKTHIDDLRDALATQHVASGDWLVGASQATDKPMLWHVQELVRQVVFRNFHEEIPYVIRQKTVGLEHTGDAMQLEHELHVEKVSQLKMLIGSKGAAANRVREQSEQLIAQVLRKRVTMSLAIKCTSPQAFAGDFAEDE